MNEPTKQQRPLFTAVLARRAQLGATIAFVLMSLFLLNVRYPDPSWPQFWYLRPLIMISLGGAAGGVFYHLMANWSYEGGWKKAVAIVVSLIVYLFGLWISSVLGMAGTLWN